MLTSLFTRSLRRWLSLDSARQSKPRRQVSIRLGLETLEDRLVPASITLQAPDIATLKADINYANSNTNGNQFTITLSKTGNYHFTSTDNSFYGNNALPVIASNITIDGQGVTLSVDSSISDRFFFVADYGLAGNLNSGSLTLKNMTLSNGFALGGASNQGGGGLGAGGAIFNQGGLTLSNVTFTNDTAQGGSSGANLPGARGGGGIGGNANSTGTAAGLAGLCLRTVLVVPRAAATPIPMARVLAAPALPGPERRVNRREASWRTAPVLTMATAAGSRDWVVMEE